MIRRAFTLIELLIVVAIIAILAAIAVPNFLEAQTRSKVSRAKADMRSLATAIEAYVVDHNILFPDGNDPGIDKPGLNFETENGTKTDARPNENGSLYGILLRTYYRWRPITTPVAYITSIPKDSFSVVMPFGYETWWNFEERRPYFCLITCMGPDRDMDSGYDAPNSIYDASNGTVSGGDIYRAAGVTNADWVRKYFGDDFNFNN